jgi:Ca2+-binding RTX toxin-like protein
MSPRRHALATRKGAVLGALLLAAMAGPAGSWAGPAHAEEVRELGAALCNGLTPTQTGEPGVTLIGTPGNDVIVTKGAARVDSGAGDDSICVTGRGTAMVNAGPDDDFVGARGHKGKTFVSLGFGDDAFFGGSGDDRVWSQEASNQSSPDDQDRIETAAGDDYVISGSSAASNTDVVSLGPGDDELVTYGFAADATLLGGLGTNSYQPLPGPDVSGDWTFDNVTGQATLDSVTQLVWSSFQQFDLKGLHGPSVRFLGSRASEWVVAAGTCRAVLRGRAGDDRLTVDAEGCSSLPAGDALLVGGPGDDLLNGSGGDDVLRGGRGRDRVDGGEGSDRCTAETPISCELSGD